ncbi:cellulase family glycosylhydrolase [Nakamurella flavida]|uniref:mannan endo-1,4-beta-mannosidase n=1 Tax=Nakamurella flavida TaxID=363630 RepID=A0A938YHZ1_9ACTN|nr:cellulase family glycosylhydrolase [Nakamurella flavida]MBM9475083.1 cellulase family glycosylhydrolase [Nakamurella flavida]MDP9776652.1 hypothetical protein [Nakamurella flavida]
MTPYRRTPRASPLARLATAGLLLAVLAGCTTGGLSTDDTSSATTAPPVAVADVPGDADSFVTTDGMSFAVDGQPFPFVGVNIYDAAASDRYSCNPGTRLSDADLTETLRRLHDDHGATVLRFWAYQTYTQGGTDYRGVDRVITAAKEVGMRVLPVLEDGPGDCTTSSDGESKDKYAGDTWYSQGYKEPYGNATLAYRNYVGMITQHYKDEPTILGWSLINEADTSARDSTGESVLVPFSKDMADVVQAADPNHLLTLGTQSNGAPGASGTDFTAVYSLPQLDFAEVHDWGYWGADDQAMPGGDGATPPDPQSAECQTRTAPIGCSFALAPALGKPLLVGEAGIQATDADARERRADQLTAKMRAAFGAGAGGYLLWQVNTENTDGYGILLADQDPVLTDMGALTR